MGREENNISEVKTIGYRNCRNFAHFQRSLCSHTYCLSSQTDVISMAEYIRTIDQRRVRQMAKSTIFHRSMSSNFTLNYISISHASVF